ncbi:MAG: hypothetical protein R3245_01290, partial [Kiloniellales bacterium]|nr:hypothetical protein [Kiloniellales bacterium]
MNSVKYFKILGLFLAGILVALFWVSPRSFAQEQQPLTLFPLQNQEEAPLDGAVDSQPPTPAISGDGALQNLEEKSQSREQIEVDVLDEVAPESVGILGPQESGFHPNIWQGSRSDHLIGLMAGVEGGLTSQTLRDLLERLLLTRARAPLRPAGAGDQTESADFLTARVEALMDLGRPLRVLELLERVPRAAFGESVARARVEALLVAARYDEACSSIRQEILAFHAEPFWGRSLIFCQIRDG